MQSIRLTCAMGAQVAVLWYIFSTSAYAIPSPLAHTHDPVTVHWEEDGSPDGSVDHNHLTSDPIVVAGRWNINKAWDDTLLRNKALADPPDADWAHGMITNSLGVRYGWDAAQLPPVDARDAVETAYDAWQADALTEYRARKDPWDRLAIDFKASA